MKYILLFFILLSCFVGVGYSQIVIKMKREGGVSTIPCKVNGLNLNFIFDTGASDVSISMAEATFMFKNGYLTKENIIGSQNYIDATGNISEGILVLLKEIEISGIKLFDVKATITKTLNAPLLLGQSALSKLGSFKLDLEKNELIIYNLNQFIKSPLEEFTIHDIDSIKFAINLLIKYLNNKSTSTEQILQYFILNISETKSQDSLWANPDYLYRRLNTNYDYYSHISSETLPQEYSTLSYFNGTISQDNSPPTELLDRYKLFLKEKLSRLSYYSKTHKLNWSLFDSTSLKVIQNSSNEIEVTFRCADKYYIFKTKYLDLKKDNKFYLYLPTEIESKSFFEFRTLIFNEFYSRLDEIKNSKDQNHELSFFYEHLATYFESDYNKLSPDDKDIFSDIIFEPPFWCERAATLEQGVTNDDLLRKIKLYSKGISLYEKNVYPFIKQGYYFYKLFYYRGQRKLYMNDFYGAYSDFKKITNLYEQVNSSHEFLKYDITEVYLFLSRVCYKLKKYDECSLSIERGIKTYSTDLDKYLVDFDLSLLYRLKGELYYFVYKNKEKACESWTKAFNLGEKTSQEYIQSYCK